MSNSLLYSIVSALLISFTSFASFAQENNSIPISSDIVYETMVDALSMEHVDIEEDPRYTEESLRTFAEILTEYPGIKKETVLAVLAISWQESRWTEDAVGLGRRGMSEWSTGLECGTCQIKPQYTWPRENQCHSNQGDYGECSRDNCEELMNYETGLPVCIERLSYFMDRYNDWACHWKAGGVCTVDGQHYQRQVRRVFLTLTRMVDQSMASLEVENNPQSDN